jgi:hypothetical protein
MSEESTSKETTSEEATSQPEGQDLQAQLDTLRADLQEAIKRRDKALADRREAQKQLQDTAYSKAKDEKDIEALEASWAAKVEEWKSKHEALNSQFNRVVIDSAVEKEAAKSLTSPDLFLKVYRDQFEAQVDDNGGVQVKVKNSADTLTDLVAKFGERYPGLKKSELKPGMGSRSNIQGPAVDVQKLARMESSERRAYLRQNPDALKALLNRK